MRKNILYHVILAMLMIPAVGLAQENFFVGVINRVTYMIVWPIVIGAVIVAFIYAGFLYLTAQGDPGKISDAHKALIYAVIGVVVAILAFSAQQIIEGILGV